MRPPGKEAKPGPAILLGGRRSPGRRDAGRAATLERPPVSLLQRGREPGIAAACEAPFRKGCRQSNARVWVSRPYEALAEERERLRSGDGKQIPAFGEALSVARVHRQQGAAHVPEREPLRGQAWR